MRPAGYPTLWCAIDDLATAGFTEHFGVSGHALRAFDSGRIFSAGQVVIREFHRFEGVSDPDDMSIVYAIEGQGGVRGTLVDAFGAYSDPRVSAFLDGVPIRGASRFVPPKGREGSTAREPSRFGSYGYGFLVPVLQDPWHDEGGESGSVS